MEIAKISMQRGNISLSAEGAESFVRDAITIWEQMLAVGQQPMAIDPTDNFGDVTSKRPAPNASQSILQNYDHVFDTVNDQMKIIAHLSAKSKAEKTRQVALLILYGNYLQGHEHVQSEQIRSACVDQGCYDQANFAGYLKGLKSNVVMNTKAGGQYDIKLTAPGRKSAKELVDQLQASGQ